MLYLKFLKESVLFAVHALTSNKLRAFLSLLGISIGIFAIISVFTVVDTLEGKMRDSFASLGSNVVYVEKWPWLFDGDYPWWKYIDRPLSTYKELSEIQERSSLVGAAAFVIYARQKTIKYQNNSVENVLIQGVSQDYNQIRALDIEDGRFFSQSESNMGHTVVLLGHDVAESLFPLGNAIDKDVVVNGRKLKVIGVFKKEGAFLKVNSLDNAVMVPINYVRTIISLKSMRINPSIQVKGKAGVPNSELIGELRGVMRAIRNLHPKEEDNFALNEPSLISKKLDSVFSVLGKAGWLIGGFSMLVGGFGIANIMFVSVKERTNIIGIQKSLGAKNYFILMQFLVEAVILCLIGGAMGLFVIFLGTQLCTYAFNLPVTLSLANIQLGLGVSGIIGLISGFMPAYSASQMDPVEAIRSN